MSVPGRFRTIRRRPLLAITLAILGAASSVGGCRRNQEMADQAEMPDTMEVMRAIEDPTARDSMLDTLPGGEMVRGDSAAEMRLLKDKM